MNKSELITAVSEKACVTKTYTEKTINALFEVITSELFLNGKITLHGIGTLVVKKRPARKGRNPNTGEPLDIPARKTIFLRSSKVLKDAVNL